MKIAFTGTRKGMTGSQCLALAGLLKRLKPTEFHHGDCIGSDAIAHTLVRAEHPKARVNVHPTIQVDQRAFCNGDYTWMPLPFLDRDKSMVDHASVLIATPKGQKEELRSGTWATVRYAKKQGKTVYLVFPDGMISEIAP